MHSTSDIYPVSDFNRKPSEHIKRVQETKKPEILTVNGKAAVVMIDPESYDRLVQNTALLETLETIHKANAEHEAGLSKSIDQVFNELKAELKDERAHDI